MGEKKDWSTEEKALLVDAGAALEKIKRSELEKKARLIVELAARAPVPREAMENLAHLAEARDHKDSMARLCKDTPALGQIIFILGASPFLSHLLISRPELLDWLFLKGGLKTSKTRERFREEINRALEKDPLKDTPTGPKEALRLYRQAEFLRLGARDLLGLAAMEETTGELSHLAGAMLDAALMAALGETKKDGKGKGPAVDPATCGLAIIGLGKLGAEELNYSSDIDIMYIHDGSREFRYGTEMSAGEFHARLAKKVNKLISEQTPNGIVFRVDLALRPGGSSGPLTQSLAGAELYYEAQGREWERAAMIKASPVAGDEATGRAFMEMITPFVYRKYLDFTAIEEIKAMKEKIDLSMKGQGLGAGDEGFNVKLGRGGIREIEFFAQTLELIYGGRDPELRKRSTISALEALAAKGRISKAHARTLTSAYEFLRNLEHRLQIIECRQTHTIGRGEKEQLRIARMMGYRETRTFLHELRRVTSSVQDVYGSLFYEESDGEKIDTKVLALFSPETSEDEQRSLLREMGFRDEAAALGKIELMRKGPAGLRRTGARARAIFERAAPFLLSKILASPDPDMALANLEGFISRAGARSTQYALLLKNPGVAEKLIFIFGTSEFLSRGVTERPEDIDLLLSGDIARPLKTEEETRNEFRKEVLVAGEGLEARLDAMRRVRNSEVLRIGLNHMAGALDTAGVSDQMTRLAEAALDTAITLARDEVVKKIPEPPGASFAVIGLGKLGSGELTFGSDLDIIFIYDTRHPGNTRSAPPVDPLVMDFFVRLSQRVISALTIKTREGSLFSVDTRLRPSGSSGPLVVSRGTFITYHRQKTALWERQAFIRARCVAGDRALGAEALEEVKEIIFSKSLTPEEARDLIRIRKRMEDEIAPENKRRYNFKTGRGGLTDIEFLVQALELRWGKDNPALREPATLAALHALTEAGHMDQKESAFLEKAYAFIRRIEMAERITRDRPETFLPKDKDSASPLARSLGYKGSDPGAGLLRDYEKTRTRVREIFKKTLNTLAEEKSKKAKRRKD